MEALWGELGLPACGPTVSNFDLGVHAHLYGSVISKAHPWHHHFTGFRSLLEKGVNSLLQRAHVICTLRGRVNVSWAQLPMCLDCAKLGTQVGVCEQALGVGRGRNQERWRERCIGARRPGQTLACSLITYVSLGTGVSPAEPYFPFCKMEPLQVLLKAVVRRGVWEHAVWGSTP